jgi:PIN domain nuclease of toxin-antitoxin system
VTNLLLDTHILLWLDNGDRKLSEPTRRAIEDARRDGARILLSAVSVWEISMLVEKGSLELDVAVERWVERVLDQSGLEAVPLDHVAASRAYALHDLEHRDPADRLLIGTAIVLGCPLVTYDDRIRRFARTRGKQYGFSVL